MLNRKKNVKSDKIKQKQAVALRLAAFAMSLLTMLYPTTAAFALDADTAGGSSRPTELQSNKLISNPGIEPVRLDIAGIESGVVAVGGTAVVNPTLSTNQLAAITSRATGNTSLETTDDFYILALYICNLTPGGTNPTTNIEYNFMKGSTDNFTISSTLSLSPIEYNGSTVYFTDDGTQSGTPLVFTYPGIGTEEYPFAGTLTSSYINTSISLDDECTALFGCLSTSATLFSQGWELKCNGSRGALAQTLAVNGNMTLDKTTVSGTVNNSLTSAPDTGLLFGRVAQAGASSFTLTLTNNFSLTATSLTASANGSAGAIAGKIDAGVSLTLGVSGLTIPTEITAVGGNAGGIIGTVAGTLTLPAGITVTIGNSITSSVGSNGGHAGGIVGNVTGSLVTSGALTLSLANEKNIFSTYCTTNQSGGGAGGLAGALTSAGSPASHGSITLNGALTLNSFSVSGGHYAGGILGYAAPDTSFTRTGTLGTGIIVNGGTIRSANSVGTAGGFAGTLEGCTVSGLTGEASATFTLTESSIDGGRFIGGFAGRWMYPVIPDGQASALIADANVKIGTSASDRITLKFASSGYAVGGLVGSIKGDNPGNADVTVSGTSLFLFFSKQSTTPSDISLGGLFGRVTDGIYCGCTSVAINATGMSSIVNGNNVHIGALAGFVNENCILDVNGAHTVQGATAATTFVGAIVASAALRFSGSLTYSGDAKLSSVVFSQDKSLVFCESGWALTRNNIDSDISDDIGNYGQIIRNGATAFGGPIITFTPPAVGTHASVSLTAISGATASAVGISSCADFARLSITMASRGCFSAVSGVNAGNFTTSGLMDAAITFEENTPIDLTHTGIESLSRTDNTNSPFTGTLAGNGSTVTLAIGRHYPDSDTSLVLTDKTVKHAELGLFPALADTASISNLTIAGFIKGDPATIGIIHAGGIAGTATGAVSIAGVTSGITLNCQKEGDSKSHVGGVLGQYTGTSLTVTGCRTDADITLLSGTSNAGGLVGYIRANGNAAIDFSGCTISCNISNSSSSSNKEACVGGVAATIDGSDYVVTLDLDTLIFDSPVITVKATDRTGGLLGYSWSNVNASFQGAVNGTINITGTACVGGLVNTVTGKLELLSGTTLGYTLTRNVNGKSGVSDGLVVCDGKKSTDDGYKSLYLVVKCASDFASGVNITGFTHLADSLDYLVGNNIISYDTESGIAVKGGIISIETGDGFGKMPASGSGWYALPKNPNTRYYYNLDVEASTGLSISSGAVTVRGSDDILLFHLKKYADGTLYFGNDFDYFHATSGTSLNCNPGLTLDMSGSCLYPTTVSGGFAIDFNGSTLTFGLPGGGDITNPLSQNYGVMTGILLNATNGSLTVRDGTLTGTVSSWGETHSGAIVTGTATGTSGISGSTDTMLSLSLTNLTSTGLSVNGAAGALLINRIGTCVTVQISDITSVGTTDAATALIGTAGGTIAGADAKKLNITFSDMKVSGTVANGQFTVAAFIASLSNCNTCIYNFNDDTVNVTYCLELGDNITEYYNSTAKVTNGTTYDFSNSTVWIPYVIGNISVNVKGGNLTAGCGTKGDPYVINTYAQLISIMTIINGTATPSSGFLVNYPSTTPADPEDNTTHTAALALHTEYVYTSGTSLSKSSGVAGTLTLVDLRSWLNNAYYQITDDITTDASFIGIGIVAYAFSGHIDGGNNTISLSGFTASDFGFISFSNGCSLANIVFSYSEVSVSYTANIAFGGAIGTVLDGDNILDKVTVSYTSLTAVHRNSYIGGYVGVVKKGGVVFKNMTDTTGASVVYNTSPNGVEFYYASPFIGRVLDGYAFSETVTLTNGNKNYYIPTIDAAKAATAHGLTIVHSGSTNTVIITSGEGLYLFSAAFNSSSLSRAGYLSALVGFAETADYTNPWNITLSDDCDVSGYYNGFRGIGGMYTVGPTLKLGTLEGGGKFIKVNRTIVQYSGDSVKATSLGLINSLSSTATLQNLTVRGTVDFRVASAETAFPSYYAGGVVGSATAALTLNNISAGGASAEDSLAVYSQSQAGGLVGYSTKALNFVNCGYQNIKVEGWSYVGGFCGGTSGGAITITATTTTPVIENGLIRYLGAPTQNTGAGGLIGWTDAQTDINNPSAGTAKITLSNIVVFTSDVHAHINEIGFGGVLGFIRNKYCTITNLDVAGLYILGYTTGDTGNNESYNAEYKISDNVRDFTEAAAEAALDGSVSREIAAYFNNSIFTLLNSYSEVSDKSYINPGVGGIIGSVGVNGTSSNSASVAINDVRVYATASSCVALVGGNAAGGLIGDYRYSLQLTINDSSFNAENLGNAIVAGGTRAAGIVAYLRGTSGNAAQPLSAANVTVGCPDHKTVFVSAREAKSSISSGIVSEAIKGAVINTATVQNCIMTGNASGGAVGISTGGGVTLNDVTVKDCVLYARNAGLSYAGGIIFALASSSLAAANFTSYLNRITVEDNTMVVFSDSRAGGIIGYSNGANIYGNQLLWKDNKTVQGVSSTENYNTILTTNFSSLPAAAANGGVLIGTIGGSSGKTVSILGFCRTESGTVINYPEIGARGSATARILYSSYGSTTNGDIANANKQLAPNPTVYGGLTLWGDAVFEGRAETLNGLPDSWWKATAKWNSEIYGALSDRITTYGTVDTANGTLALPLFYASNGTGNGVNAFVSYLNLLTNGGFGIWTNVSATSVYYTYSQSTNEFESPENGGSIAWNGNSFVLGNRYDNISASGNANTFTLVTITFTNDSGSGSTSEYSMTVPVYFPQVLQMTTNVIPLGYEEYTVSAFVDSSAITSVSTLSNGFFSLYIEYVYSDVRLNDEWNMVKTLQYSGRNRLPEGTQLVLIDLNASDTNGTYGKSYVYRVPNTAAAEILWSDFTFDSYISLSDLKSVGYYTTANTAESIINSDETANFGIERYLIVAHFPSENRNPVASAYDYAWTADVINDRNIQIEGNENSASATVSVWNPATLTVESEQAHTGIAVQKTTGISVFVNADIQFPMRYSSNEGERSAWYGVFADPWLTDAQGTRVPFPAGTQFVIDVNSGTLETDLLVKGDGDSGDNVSRNYNLFINLNGIDSAVYKSFSSASDYYDCHVKYYLTQDPSNPQSGIAANEITVRLTTGRSVPLSISADNTDNVIGVNVYTNENEIVNIPFTVFADMNNYTKTSDESQYVLRFSLKKKYVNNVYVSGYNGAIFQTTLPAENGAITHSEATVTASGNYWTANVTDLVNPTTHELSIDMVLNSADSVSMAYNSYMLTAELLEVVNTTETVISNSDYFIFLVANIKTDIE